jgi:glycosyltransferase involved in cell wall biosynthesis
MARLSVVLTNYNNAWCISRSIEAIVSQSRSPDELIIQDDGSTDNSVEVIMPYVEKYPCVKLMQNEINRGPVPARQKVADSATCEYVYAAVAGDWVLPGYFEKAMDMFSKYPQAGLSCANPCVYVKETGLTNEMELMWSEMPAYLSPDEVAEVIAGMAVYGHTAIVRKDAFDEAGGFLPELKWHGDWFYCLVIAFRYGLIYFPEAVAIDNTQRHGEYCFSGSSDWNQQKDVIANVFRHLKSPRFRDVLPNFIRGGVLNLFPYDTIKVVMSNPEFWDAESLLLIQHPLYTWNNRLVQIRNDRAKIALERKVASLIKKCEGLIEKHNLSEVDAIVNDLLRQFPNLADVFTLKAKLEIAKNNFPLALDACKKVIFLQPLDAKASVLEGFIHYQMKNYSAAEESFLNALACDPSNLDALLNLAELSMSLKKGDAALNLCRKAVSLYPQNSEVLSIHGDFHAEMNQPEDAINCYERALEVDPSNALILQKIQKLK